MRLHYLTAAAVIACFATRAAADPVANLADGLAALDRHDEVTAVRQLSAALDSRLLSATNEELALVKRAQAYLLAGRDDEALSDSKRALALQPGDAEAARVHAYAAKVDLPTPHGPIVNTDRSLNAAVAARNVAVNGELAAGQANYQAALAAFEQKKADDAKAYAAEMAAYDVGVQAQQQQAAAAQAAWKAAVAACKGGEYAKCGKR